jgi:hypothetical protein
MMAVRLSIALEHLGYDRGHWCNSCNLPSAVRHWLILRSVAGMSLQARLRCHDCGGHDVAVDPDALAA